MSGYDTLSDAYDQGRLGYANDVYDALVGFGLSPRLTILDIGCGTGLASGPLIANGFKVTGIDASEPMLENAKRRFPEATWVAGSAEALPFDDASFGAAISAQVFHHLDGEAAMRELKRVLKPGGIAGIWWKHLMHGDPVKQLREDVARDLGVDPPVSGLNRGFKEFYAAQFAQTSIRVIPWRAALPLSQYLQYERSRRNLRDEIGIHAEKYFEVLEGRLRETFGAGDPTVPLSYVHYLYLAKK